MINPTNLLFIKHPIIQLAVVKDNDSVVKQIIKRKLNIELVTNLQINYTVNSKIYLNCEFIEFT